MFALLATVSAHGQSTDVGFPTPVITNEVAGRITPRDLGDARLTRHFYAFTGKEGDLVVTIESANLDGAIDVFTASTLRPLAKISLYASASSGKTSKSVYLRKEEALILRVEARTVGDTDGSYRIQFEGAFTPSANVAAPEPATTATADSASSRRAAGARRATATGARIPETAEEKAERLEAEAKERAAREALAAEEKARRDAIAAAKESERLEKERARSEEKERREAALRASVTARSAKRTETSRRAQPTEAESEKTSEPAPRSTPSRSSRARSGNTLPPRAGVARGRASRAKPQPKPTEGTTAGVANTPEATTAPPEAGARLIIETKNGARLVREMSTVRRVTIENNQIVVTGRDGKIERQPMTNVLRMSIEP